MNAAARFLKQHSLSRGWAFSLLLSRAQVSTLTVLFGVLVSALSVIYVTNVTRGVNSNLQIAIAEQDQIQMQWNQLLLEKSTWTVPARVQQIAEESDGMHVPDAKSIIVVNPHVE